MADPTNPQHPANEARTSSPTAVSLLFAAVLWVLGGAMAWGGWQAIDQHHFEARWKTRSPVRVERGVQVLDGGEAVRWGAGLTASGLMLGIWGGGLVGGYISRGSQNSRMAAWLCLGWLSLACLLIAIGCFFPPWRVGSVPFFAVVAILLAFILVLPERIRKRWERYVLPVLGGAALLASSFDNDAGAGVVVGFFVALAILVHLMILFPGLQEWLLAKQRAA